VRRSCAAAPPASIIRWIRALISGGVSWPSSVQAALRPRGFLTVTLLARSYAGEGTNHEQPRSCGMSTNKTPNDTPSNAVKDPEDWATGDETMTGSQASYLKTLCQEAGEEFDPSLTKADASKRIDELQEKTGRGKFH
jgi:hypothetical protein